MHWLRLIPSLFLLVLFTADGALAKRHRRLIRGEKIDSQHRHEHHRHGGHDEYLSVEIQFLDPRGQTTTSAAGTTYSVPDWGWQYTEPDKIYPRQYWGTFPLYFVGQNVNFSVTIVNKKRRGKKRFRVRVEALHNVLLTSGRLGMALAPAQEWRIESLKPGESRVLPGSFYIAPNPEIPSGLDLTRVRVYHLEKSDDDEREDDDSGDWREKERRKKEKLLVEARTVWCPPSPEQLPD